MTSEQSTVFTERISLNIKVLNKQITCKNNLLERDLNQ